jgi:hypothetical protein
MPSTKYRKHRRSNRRTTQRRKRHGSRRMRGGAGGFDWVASNFGATSGQQFQNTFGPNPLYPNGAIIPTLPGAPAVVPGTFPQGSQGGGRRHSWGGRRRRRH